MNLDHDDNDNNMRELLGFLEDLEQLAAMLGAGSLKESHDEHQEWHRQKIKKWEDKREDLTTRFDAQVAADMIELQRMSARLCEHNASSLSMLSAAIAELMDATNGDEHVMMPVAVKFVKLVKEVKRVRKAYDKRMAEAKAKADEVERRRTEAEKN